MSYGVAQAIFANYATSYWYQILPLALVVGYALMATHILIAPMKLIKEIALVSKPSRWDVNELI
jgi:hypothetical protein